MNKYLCTLGLLFMISGAVQAATIEWGVVSTVGSDSDISTTGALEYAYTAGGTSAVAVNGVLFSAGDTTFGGDVVLSGTPATTAVFGQNAAPFNTLSSDYQSMLDEGVYNNVGNKTDPVTVTLNSLTIGQNYAVQVWGNDSRNSNGRNMTVASGTNSVVLDYNSTDVLGGVGQTVSGTFTADAETQDFTLTPNLALSFNAIQVRDLSEPVPYEWELETVLALGNLTNAPALYTTNYLATTWTEVCAEIIATGEAQPILYEGLDYNGHATRVFAWVGLPADLSESVPAIVLAHGAGSGTAYKTWVDLWNARGYAAIAMDFNGKKSDESGSATALSSLRGPVQDGRYNNSVTYPAVALTNHWMYHCVADSVLAHSLLASMPEVNANQIGQMGVSWGGTITSTTIGINPRLAFAIPTYGCGHLYDSYPLYGPLADCELYRQVWDPMIRIHRAILPVLWYSWPTDPHFPVDCQAETYFGASGERMVTLIPGMTHNHPAAWNREDSYAFADSVISNGTPWCKEQSLELSNNVATVTFTSSKMLDSAVLVSTKGLGFAGDLSWTQTSATLSSNGGGSWTVTATLPANTTGWFVNVLSDTLVVSSDYQEIITLSSDQLEMNHSIYSSQSTGTVAVAFTAPTNVEVIDVSIGNESHPGAFVNATSLPLVDPETYPSTFPVGIAFDNTIAGLTDGQTASATLTFVWHELDGSTDQIELPIQVLAYSTLEAEVEIYATSNTDYGSNTTATMISSVLTAGSATFQIAFDVVPMVGTSIRSGDGGGSTTSKSWGIFSSGETGNPRLNFNGNAGEYVERIANLRVTNFNANGSGLASEDITDLSFRTITIADAQSSQDRVVVAANGVTNNASGEKLASNPFVYDLETLAGSAMVTNCSLAVGNASTTDKWSVNSIRVGYSVQPFSGNPFLVWVSDYGLIGDDALPEADSIDQDGYDNLAEYALGMNPTNSDAGSRDWKILSSEGGTNWFEYVHYRRSGLSYLLIDSTNLVDSVANTNAQDQILIGPALDGYEPVTNRYLTDESAKFIQLKIQQD
ncbi:acetylxylan esterase [Pontiellaceae bacterium B1224]|nr:acetylxylan esterase [Pontiellaceae bacterium B1224]